MWALKLGQNFPVQGTRKKGPFSQCNMCEIRFGVKIVTYGFFVYSASFGSCRRMLAVFCLSECLASEFSESRVLQSHKNI